MSQLKFYSCFLIIIFVFSFSKFTNAQTIVKGKVSDVVSWQPLEAAPVAIIDGYKTFSLSADNKTEIKIELQSNAFKLADPLLQATGTTKFSSIAKIDLALTRVNNTQELLRIVSGLCIAQHGGDGKAEQIFLRVFDFGQEYADALFATEIRLINKPNIVTELNYTPGTPLFGKLKLAVFF